MERNARELEFLSRLASLLDEFNVEIQGTDWFGWDGGGCAGIEFNSAYPSRENEEHIYLELGAYINAEDVRKAIDI